MKIGPAGVALIESFEQCRLTAYPDSGSVWTIGWGHTRGVKKGDTCTQEQADAWLCVDLEDAEKIVNASVKKPLTQNQFDALVSFVFNIGHLGMTMLYKINAGDMSGAALEFGKWNHCGTEILPGLTRRRESERVLFTKD